ncbi:MAG: hypothetical protein ACR2P5_02090, partial [Gammaproteobacteria bacterium]
MKLSWNRIGIGRFFWRIGEIFAQIFASKKISRGGNFGRINDILAGMVERLVGKSWLVAAALAAFFAAPSAMAEGIDSGDTAWILAATALVLMMTLPGLALFYAGLVRARNAVSVMAQCFAIACVASL